MLFHRDAEPEQQFPGARFRGVAVEFGEPYLQLGNRHAFFLAHRGESVDALALGPDLPQLLVSHDHHIDDALVFMSELVLAQLAQTHVDRAHHVAGARFEIAAEDLHEGGFAAAVGADQAIAVAVAEFHRHVFKQGPGPELDGEVAGSDHEGNPQ